MEGKATHHNIFDEAKSHTFKSSVGQHWNITYGDGSSASGHVGTDVVEIGGIVVQNQAVEVANKMSAQFRRSAGDGLLGLAFVRCSCHQCVQLIDTAIGTNQHRDARASPHSRREHDRSDIDTACSLHGISRQHPRC